MTNKLPPLPTADTHCFDDNILQDSWSYSASQMKAYGQQCRDAALEEAAKVCDAQAEDAVAPKRLALMTAVGQTIQEGMYGGAKSCAGVIRNLR